MRKTVKVTCLYHAGQHFKVKNVTISATAFRSLTVVNNIFLFCYHFLSDIVFYYFHHGCGWWRLDVCIPTAPRISHTWWNSWHGSMRGIILRINDFPLHFGNIIVSIHERNSIFESSPLYLAKDLFYIASITTLCPSSFLSCWWINSNNTCLAPTVTELRHLWGNFRFDGCEAHRTFHCADHKCVFVVFFFLSLLRNLAGLDA